MLEISGVGVKNVSLTLHDIKKFPKYTVTAAIQCAGNRRSEMSKVQSTILPYYQLKLTDFAGLVSGFKQHNLLKDQYK